MLVLIRKVSDFRYIYKGWPISKNNISTLYIPHIHTMYGSRSIGGTLQPKQSSINIYNLSINNIYMLGLINRKAAINNNAEVTRTPIYFPHKF